MKRSQAVVPLGLPSDAAASAVVAQRVAELARLCPAGRSVALLDVDGGNPSLRGAVEAAIGAGRCVMFDTRAMWPAEAMRWEIDEPGKLFAPIEFAIVLSPISSYLSALRTVHDRFPGRPPVVLPHAQTTQSTASPVSALVSLGDDSPVAFVFPPNCGTNRMEPVVRALLAWLEKRRIQGIHAAGHRRLVAGIDDAPRAVFAENRRIRQALDDCYLRFIGLMDLDCWCDLHDCPSSNALRRRGRLANGGSGPSGN
jgi:hypothetical protein